MRKNETLSDDFKAFLRGFPPPEQIGVLTPINPYERYKQNRAYLEAVLEKPWDGNARTLPHFGLCSYAATQGQCECDCGIKALAEQKRLKFLLQRARFVLRANRVPILQPMRIVLRCKGLSRDGILNFVEYVREQWLARRNYLVFLDPDREVLDRLGMRVADDHLSASGSQSVFDAER